MVTCEPHSHIADVPVALRRPVMGGRPSRLQTDPGAMAPHGRPEEEKDEEAAVEEEPEVEAEEEGDEGPGQLEPGGLCGGPEEEKK